MTDLPSVAHQFAPKTVLHAGEASKVPSEDLVGWCIVYRVWAYGYAGRPIPEEILRETLDTAVKFRNSRGQFWDRIGGLGGRYGAPGKPLPPTPAQRDAAYLDDYEDEMARHAANSQDPDWDYTQNWVSDH